ncbi:MAG: hypothetical protein KIH64_003420, partial [Mycobacterium sp.]|nr:hypothetical protein [Mycobacterium sp.]
YEAGRGYQARPQYGGPSPYEAPYEAPYETPYEPRRRPPAPQHHPVSRVRYRDSGPYDSGPYDSDPYDSDPDGRRRER